MAKKMVNKMKHWRRMANKIVMMVPKEHTIENADGTKELTTVDEPVILTGRRLKAFNDFHRKEKPPLFGLLKEMYFRAGLIEINHEVELTGVPAQ